MPENVKMIKTELQQQDVGGADQHQQNNQNQCQELDASLASSGGGGGDAVSYKKLNRFSELEKRLLFNAFKEHQQIIDIKQRRSSYSSHKQAEVRACWERIVAEFNDHPDTKSRTMRQIQKFWLNSKLRNQIPSISKADTTTTSKVDTSIKSDNSSSTLSTPRKSHPTAIIKRTLRNDGTIVPTSTVTLPTSHVKNTDGNHHHMDDDASQEMQDEEVLEDEEDVEDVEDLIELKFIETVQQQQQHQVDQQQQQQQQQHHQQQPHLTFSTANLQIVQHHTGGGVQFASMENMEVIDDTTDHHHHQNQQTHHYNATNTAHHTSVRSGGQKLDRRLFCGSECGEADDDQISQNALDEHDQRSNGLDPLHPTATDQHGNEIEVVSYTTQINEIRLQEAQNRLKESQLRCELQQLAIQRAQEEMRQKRELHVLYITEMQLKLDKMKKELRMTLN